VGLKDDSDGLIGTATPPALPVAAGTPPASPAA